MVLLWQHSERKLKVLEISSKHPTLLSLSKVGSHLALGTTRGNMMIYGKRTMKKQSIMGKHSRKINCGY